MDIFNRERLWIPKRQLLRRFENSFNQVLPGKFVGQGSIVLKKSKMADAENQTYSLVWESKPLGFSIVMDTTGNNAYVSSIQKPQNVKSGLKLAAQIVKVNDAPTKDIPHNKILELIKKTTCPLTLTFQPRSFANNPNSDKQYSPFLSFSGAVTNEQRINGGFELVDGNKDKYVSGNSLVNGQPVWRRVPKAGEDNISDDPVYCWFWPASDKANQKTTDGGKDMWMISRGSQISKGSAYACVVLKDQQKVPTDVTQEWQVWSQDKQQFVDSKIKILVSRQ